MILKLIPIFILNSLVCFSQTEIVFPSLDSLPIHARLYELKDNKDKIMLLCHQARWSRGEYKETAPRFNELGYTCLAIDQRSGDSINGLVNLTAKLAKEKNKPCDYIDAEKDIVAALNFLNAKYKTKIILVGSSYSSALIIKVAANNKNKVKSIISYSPGEYFNDTTIIGKNLKKLEIPVYITCAKNEVSYTKDLANHSNNKKLVFYIPTSDGKHGAKALWKRNKDNAEYWESLLKFLKENN
jgi:pimeloyl-ACP methyl ester carboxylesterase